MNGLLRSEALRFRSRRLFVTLFVLAALGALIGVTIGAAHSHKPSADLASRLQTTSSLSLARLPTTFENTAFILIVLGLVIGASSVGADWQAGTFGTVLTWEPRRLRVLGARCLVVGVGVFVLVIALETVLGSAMWAATALRGVTVVPPGWFGGVSGTAVRIAFAAVAAALIGTCVSTLGRNTAATLAGAFVYFAVVEALARAFVPRLSPYLLATNIVVAVLGHRASPGTTMTITPSHAHLVIGSYVAALLVVTFVVFRRRDVTS